jgi:hypothetical protein
VITPPPLHAADLRHLDAVGLRRDRLLRALALAPRLLGQPLRCLHVPVEQGPVGTHRDGVPDVLGHPQLLGQPRVDGQLAIDGLHVAELHELPEAVGVRAHHDLALSPGLADLEQLVGELEAFAGGVRSRGDEDLALQRHRERAGRIGLASDLDRLVDQPRGLDDIVRDPVHLR